MNILMKDIDKSFDFNKILTGAKFSLEKGEIHALMGENGAGKSTLMKILAGVYTKDSGQIFIDGKEMTFHSPKEAENNGILFIYQELNVLYDLTVEENLFIGKEIEKKFGICDTKKMQEKTREVLSMLGVSVSPKAIMSSLSVGQQQMIEICKALMNDAKVIIMDEPTAALTEKETHTLFEVITNLKKQGVSIIYISHRMEEIFEICDRITVMRDGSYIDTKYTKDTNINELVKMMIGREIGERYPNRFLDIGQEALEVRNLSLNGIFNNISFNICKGEVLGIAGLMGAGRTEIMQSIFGNMPYQQGKIIINKIEKKIKSPRNAIQNGIGYITEDRKIEGLMLDKSIRENVSLSNLNKVSKKGIVSKIKEENLVQSAIKDFNIKCFGSETISGKLSGGNQQKVVLAKWILKNPKILILDEPTRGVDVGSKKEIYNIINTLVSRGVAIIMVSSELPELLGMSDRILVIHEGKITGILEKNQFSQENIMTLATGGGINDRK